MNYISKFISGITRNSQMTHLHSVRCFISLDR
uniref:Uncharacterized protein n=1 Tax=Rhizophora mucronata TaxID=61149 RepID=A0A2P2IKK9_RHIMU